jgi:CDP-paratose 2-epimerase
VKILITGGAGFLGSHIAEFYDDKGDEVTVVDNLSRSLTTNLPKHASMYNWNYLKQNHKNVKLVRGDIRNLETLSPFKEVDIIYHAAAQVAVTTSLVKPWEDFENNAIGTFNVLETARNAKTEPIVIYMSTNKVYGANINNIPVREKKTRYAYAGSKYSQGIPEEFPIDHCEHTPYGCSKLCGDLYTQEYSHIYGLRTGVFRMSCIYGDRQLGTEDQGWLGWFIIATLLGKPITIFGDGKQVRDVLFISDAITAYDAFVNSKSLSGEVFNLGGGVEHNISVMEALDAIERITGNKPAISHSNWRAGDQKVYISDTSKAKTKLDWSPRVTTNAGIKKLINWTRANIDLFNARRSENH